MVEVNKDTCIGCGACSATCPNSFSINNDGKAEAISQEVVDCTKQAAEGCPVNAITVAQ